MPERAAKIAEFLKSLSEESSQTPVESFQVVVSGPIVICLDRTTLLAALEAILHRN